LTLQAVRRVFFAATSFLSSLSSFGLSLVTTTANYNTPVFITSATPPNYSPGALGSATGSSLGFAYNAQAVLNAIQDAIVKYRKQIPLRCATQADVIAHSMGGDITRYVAAKLPAFPGIESFAAGNIHELITIGTPHQGSPLATHLLSGDSNCTAGRLASLAGSVSLMSATIGGVTWDGGVGDLVPNSAGLLAINPSNPSGGPQIPTALIAGAMTAANTSSLGNVGVSALIKVCGNSDFLASNLTSSAWPTVFGSNDPGNSDGIVPSVTSQCTPLPTSASSCYQTVPGLVHSRGMVGRRGLGFTGPTELDGSSGIVPLIIQLLNAAITGTGTPFAMVP
jgi:pimeloyl-ACP methyl ester carboxylesterase